MKLSVFLATMIYAGAAHAELETDKSAGNCAAFMSAKQSTQGAREAIGMADNQKRALAFANKWFDEAGRHKNNKAALEGFMLAAASDCRKLGIRPSDY